MPRESQIVVDFDQQVRKPNLSHVRRQPPLEVSELVGGSVVEPIGGIDRQLPSLFRDAGVVVGRGGCEEPIERVAETSLKVRRHVDRLRRQTRPSEEPIAGRLPLLVWDEEVIEVTKALAVPHGEIARPNFVAGLQEDRALPRRAAHLVT